MTVDLIAENIDIPLLKQQRSGLLVMESNEHPSDMDIIEGVVNMIDAMLDKFENEPEIKTIPCTPSGASGTLSGRCEDTAYTEIWDEEGIAIIAHEKIHTNGAVFRRKVYLNNSFGMWEPYITMSKDPSIDDPYGKDQHEAGAKLDAWKPRPALVLGSFAEALKAVTKVGTYGAHKYTDNGWKYVPDGAIRYQDAALRHWLEYLQGERINEEDGDCEHLAQVIWNLMAVYELSKADDLS